MALKTPDLDLMGISSFAHQSRPIPTSAHLPQPIHSCDKHQSPLAHFQGLAHYHCLPPAPEHEQVQYLWQDFQDEKYSH